MLVEAKDLTIEYPGRLGSPAFKAVDGVSFTVSEGEVFGLVGESGSGKTTIGRAIAGLNRTTGGSLKVLGYEMLNFKERTFKPLRKEIGFVFQDPAASLQPAADHRRLRRRTADHPRPSRPTARGAQAGRRAARVGAAAGVVRRPVTRTSSPAASASAPRLARALMLNPKLLIADEPTSALDVSVQAKVLELFKEIQAEFGFACLFISHDLAVVDILSHWVGVLYKGKMVEQGLGNQVMGNPQHDYTQETHRLPARSGPRRTGQAAGGVPRGAAQLTAGTGHLPIRRGPILRRRGSGRATAKGHAHRSPRTAGMSLGRLPRAPADGA